MLHFEREVPNIESHKLTNVNVLLKRLSSLLTLITDYVYFENSSSNPYLIRRIEELNKTATGNVEAKVVCFYRRRDISNTLIMLADKHA
ncbi:Metastasis-associated protein MTA3, partial [Galemys pyrenaicus]